MDPQATLLNTLDALVSLHAEPDAGDDARAAAAEGLRNLADWLDRDGFPPAIGNPAPHRYTVPEPGR